MTSKIKVDNINKVSDDSNIINKCGTTVTVGAAPGNFRAGTNNIQAADGGNLISQCGATITLGASGDTVSLASGASQTGFGRTGTVDWDTTPKVTGDSPITAVTGKGYFLNTTAGAITVNLPAGAAGSIVSMADYAATWQTSNVTVSANGSEKIGGEAQDATLDTKGQSVTFVYVDAVQGWLNTMDSTSNVRGTPPYMEATVSGSCNTLVTSGDCKIATFVNPGTFTVTRAAICAADNIISYMVQAGGGASGDYYGAGGGAGGFRELKSPTTPYTASPLDGYPTPGNRITVSATAYPITVGAGGAATPRPATVGTSGGTSTFSSISSAGGGGGSGSSGTAPAGAAGGSGGGGGGHPSVAGGAGNTPPVSPPQGNNGGTGGAGPVGGGGGATTVGESGPNGGGGIGAGTGINPSSCVGTGGPSAPLRYFGGGGAGTGGASSPYAGAGGGGGGYPPTGSTSSGRANTGGGGANENTAGGSGIVILRYKFQ